MTFTDSDSIRRAYDAMLQELSEHEGVTITENKLGAPIASRGDQEAIATNLGIPLTPALAAYLGFANGVDLQWTYEGGYGFGGSIGLMDVSIIDNPNSWPGPSDALEYPPNSYGIQNPEAPGAVFPIEFFQRNEDNIELAGVIAHREGLDVFVSEDDIACLTDTALLSFGDYLDLLIRSFGSSMARAALQMGFSNKEGKHARDLFPGLFEKDYSLAALIELRRSEPNVGQTYQFFR